MSPEETGIQPQRQAIKDKKHEEMKEEEKVPEDIGSPSATTESTNNNHSNDHPSRTNNEDKIILSRFISTANKANVMYDSISSLKDEQRSDQQRKEKETVTKSMSLKQMEREEKLRSSSNSERIITCPNVKEEDRKEKCNDKIVMDGTVIQQNVATARPQGDDANQNDDGIGEITSHDTDERAKKTNSKRNARRLAHIDTQRPLASTISRNDEKRNSKRNSRRQQQIHASEDTANPNNIEEEEEIVMKVNLIEENVFAMTRAQRDEEENDEDQSVITSDSDSTDQQPGAFAIPGFGVNSMTTTTTTRLSSHGSNHDGQEGGENFVPVEVVNDDELVARFHIRDLVKRRIIKGLTIATEVTDIEEQQEIHTNYKYILKLIIIFGFSIIIITFASIIFFSILQKMSKKNNTISPTEIPSESSSSTTTTTPISDFVYVQQLLFNISGNTLFNVSTNQYQSLEWLIYDDPLQLNVKEMDHSTIINRFVIVLLYFATNGPNWIIDYNFLSNSSVCDWNDGRLGIQCNVNGELTDINLDNNNLNGTIPDELSAIKSTEFINFYGNSLYGTIPSSFGNLPILDYLQLAWNSITGSIPQSLENLHKLKLLNLAVNQLTGSIPKDIFQKTPGLQYLNLAFNYISGTIPSYFAENVNLRTIFLGDNFLDGSIPKSIFTFQTLETFGIWSTSITGPIPLSENISLQNLEYIYLYDNLLRGTIPTSLGNLENLVDLYLFSNKLNGTIPTEIGKLLRLTHLSLADNQLSGTIPSEISSLTELVELEAYNNKLIGTLPSQLVMLSNLDLVHLYNNNIIGDLDAIFCNDYREMIPIGVMSADCGGFHPDVNCSCCTICFNDDSGIYETNLNQICKANAIPIENGDFFNDKNLQSICNCTNDGRRLSCKQDELNNNTYNDNSICESCNEDGTSCGIQTDYGWELDVDGSRDVWETSFQYTLGQNINDTITFYHNITSTERRVYINREECSSCNGAVCTDEFRTLLVDCRNIINDDSGYYNGCQTPPYSGGIFDVFEMYFTQTWTGCKPFWYWSNQL